MIITKVTTPITFDMSLTKHVFAFQGFKADSITRLHLKQQHIRIRNIRTTVKSTNNLNKNISCACQNPKQIRTHHTYLPR
jgi:hypothetical protein